MSQIIIKGLAVHTHIGVPDEERAEPQRLLLDIALEIDASFTDLGDEIGRTVDYHAASIRITEVAAERPRKLIETLASEIASLLTSEFGAKEATVEVRKFILPNCEYVAVRSTKTRR